MEKIFDQGKLSLELAKLVSIFFTSDCFCWKDVFMTDVYMTGYSCSDLKLK